MLILINRHQLKLCFILRKYLNFNKRFRENVVKNVHETDSDPYFKIKQWFAHKGQINKIIYISKPDGIVTSSSDKHIKLWSF